MALAQTKAAEYMQQHGEQVSSHQVISLLMDGALERLDQTQSAISSGNSDEHAILTTKLVAIINGLRNCLNLDAGGDIANNLEALYLYMSRRITSTEGDEQIAALNEVRGLLLEIKGGWDNMERQTPELAAI